MMLEGKKVVVAGAAGLLGSQLVHKLIQQGAEVIAIDRDLISLNDKLSKSGVDINSTALQKSILDLSEESAVIKFFDSAEGITGAVNCSYPRNKNYGKHFFEVAQADFNENISLNLGSSFLFMQQCARYFEQHQTEFSLVNISSVYGVIPPKFNIYDNTKMTMPVEYAAIKSGLIHLSRYVAKYVANSKFRVNLVSPGGIFDHQPEDFLKAYKNETLGRGMLDVSDVLGSIVFLLSSNSNFVNGQNLIVDDGFSL
ncbi:oxidoreductase [Shewanella khirikhana]|uniref:Gluconate 5-dehydrogenase n=1 Tax=Shewanella khirikhana TaxID=1965282 RepID=A0ABM7DBN4_9GAMM|nr:oxidoreductase [Shewanella khirikhana]AZQ11108.1 Gluconate 5-dehydrogenase [Shewanella khirikhana]